MMAPSSNPCRPPHLLLFLCCNVMVVAGCYRRAINIQPNEVPKLDAYAKGRQVVVVERGKPIALTETLEPELELATDARTVQGRLEDMRLAEGKIVLPASRCDATVSIPLDTIRHAFVRAGDWMIPVWPHQMERVGTYGKTGHVVLNHRGKDAEVMSSLEPRLHILLVDGCPDSVGLNPVCIEGHVVTPLEHVSLEPDVVRVASTRCEADLVVDPDEPTRARLNLTHPPPIEPLWGFGIDVAGPAQLGSLTLNYYPATWLVLEAGFVPLGQGGTGGWLGTRLRLAATDYVYPTIGGSVGVVAWETVPSISTHFLTGPRVGVEFLTPSGDVLIRIEGQAAYTNLLEDTPEWRPWGGVALTGLF